MNKKIILITLLGAALCGQQAFALIADTIVNNTNQSITYRITTPIYCPAITGTVPANSERPVTHTLCSRDGRSSIHVKGSGRSGDLENLNTNFDNTLNRTITIRDSRSNPQKYDIEVTQ